MFKLEEWGLRHVEVLMSKHLYIELSLKDSVSSDSFVVTGHSEGCDDYLPFARVIRAETGARPI